MTIRKESVNFSLYEFCEIIELKKISGCLNRGWESPHEYVIRMRACQIFMKIR